MAQVAPEDGMQEAGDETTECFSVAQASSVQMTKGVGSHLSSGNTLRYVFEVLWEFTRPFHDARVRLTRHRPTDRPSLRAKRHPSGVRRLRSTSRIEPNPRAISGRKSPSALGTRRSRLPGYSERMLSSRHCRLLLVPSLCHNHLRDTLEGSTLNRRERRCLHCE